MKIIKSQNGFTVTHIALITLVTLIISGTGYYVWNAKNNANNSYNNATKSQLGAKPVTKKKDQAASNVIQKNNSSKNNDSSSATPSVVCSGASIKKEGSSTKCSYSFSAKDVPARFQLYAVQNQPTRIQLYDTITFTGTCAPTGACEHTFTQGDVVPSETRKDYLDWKIVKPATIEITTDETVTKDTKTYKFADYTYGHPIQPICTSDHWFCYDMSAEFNLQ